MLTYRPGSGVADLRVGILHGGEEEFEAGPNHVGQLGRVRALQDCPKGKCGGIAEPPVLRSRVLANVCLHMNAGAL